MKAIFFNRVWVLPVLIALIVHLPVLWGGFVYDDVPLIEKHKLLGDSGFIVDVWTRDYGLEFTGDEVGYYRPLFMSMVAALRQLFGVAPVVFHLFSLFWFAVAAGLVASVLRLAMASFSGGERNSSAAATVAVVGGVFYAVHPMRVETVSLVMSLPDLLVEILALWLVWSVLQSRQKSGHVWVATVVGLVAAMAGGLIKESAFFLFGGIGITLAVGGWWLRDERGRLWGRAAGCFFGLGVDLMIRRVVGIISPSSLHDILNGMFNLHSEAVLKSMVLTVWSFLVPQSAIFWRLFGGDASLVLGAVVLAVFVVAGVYWLWLLKNGYLFAAIMVGWFCMLSVSMAIPVAVGCPYSQRYIAVAPLVILVCLGGWVLWKKAAGMVDSSRYSVLLLMLIAYFGLHGVFCMASSVQCWSQYSFFMGIQRENPQDVKPIGAVAQALDADGAKTSEIERWVRYATDVDLSHEQVTLLHNMVIKRYIGECDYQNALRFVNWSLTMFAHDRDKRALRAAALGGLGQYEESLDVLDELIKQDPTNEAYSNLRRQIRAKRDAEMVTKNGDSPVKEE